MVVASIIYTVLVMTTEIPDIQAAESEEETTIEQLFENSMLAVAAYVIFPTGNGDDETLKTSLKNQKLAEGWAGDEGFSKRQLFIDKFSLLHHQANTPYSDFSATLFKRKSDGQITFASRGTEPGYDIWEDIVGITAVGVPYNQVRELHNYVQRLKTPSGQDYQYINSAISRYGVV